MGNVSHSPVASTSPPAFVGRVHAVLSVDTSCFEKHGDTESFSLIASQLLSSAQSDSGALAQCVAATVGGSFNARWGLPSQLRSATSTRVRVFCRSSKSRRKCWSVNKSTPCGMRIRDSIDRRAWRSSSVGSKCSFLRVVLPPAPFLALLEASSSSSSSSATRSIFETVRLTIFVRRRITRRTRLIARSDGHVALGT